MTIYRQTQPPGSCPPREGRGKGRGRRFNFDLWQQLLAREGAQERDGPLPLGGRLNRSGPALGHGEAPPEPEGPVSGALWGKGRRPGRGAAESHSSRVSASSSGAVSSGRAGSSPASGGAW